MQQRYLQYYDRYSGRAPMRFMWDSLFARPSARKHSLLNRMKDYRRLQANPQLFALHKEINHLLYGSATQWDSYDYGEGYCYQSLELIAVSGLRDTKARVEAMELKDLLKDKTVVDIGCNAGFVALSIASSVAKITGCDINPHLINIGNAAAAYLHTSNVELVESSFEQFLAEDLGPAEPVDAVLSFANHSTFDGNTKHSLEQYFGECQSLLKPGGLLLFESHHPDYEGEALEGVLSIIEAKFEVLNRKLLNYGTRMDRGRTFVVGRSRAEATSDRDQ